MKGHHKRCCSEREDPRSPAVRNKRQEERNPSGSRDEEPVHTSRPFSLIPASQSFFFFSAPKITGKLILLLLHTRREREKEAIRGSTVSCTDIIEGQKNLFSRSKTIRRNNQDPKRNETDRHACHCQSCFFFFVHPTTFTSHARIDILS